jgi:hypothetical protein
MPSITGIKPEKLAGHGNPFVLGACEQQGCQIFLVHDTKTGKMYQINTKCTKWS